VIDAVDLDLGPGVLVVHDLLSLGDGDGLEDALVVLGSRAHGHDEAGLRLLLGGLGDDNPACRLGLALLDLHEDAITDGLHFHTGFLLRVKSWVCFVLRNIRNPRHRVKAGRGHARATRAMLALAASASIAGAARIA
jgi:hypothetical protein